MKSKLKKMDKPLLVLTLIYLILGLVMILSASSVSAVLRYGVTTYYFFFKQLQMIGLAFLCGFILLFIKTSHYRYIAPIYLGIVFVLLFFVFSFGKIAGGAQSWLNIGTFNLQPTEFAKTALIIFMGCFYDNNIKKNKSFGTYFIPIIYAAILCFFVAGQPDFGGAALIAGIVFLTFITIPFPKDNVIKIMKVSAIGIGIAVVVLLYSGSDIFKSSQLSRLNFFAPCSRYTEDTGFQVCNGFIAFHNGGLFGVGLGNSTQKYLYLPEAHTDFIFPIIIEELGLLVGILVIIGFFLILWRILLIAKNSDSIRNAVICYGTFIYLLLHLLINFMGILALIPLTGVPVPFLSYGGSYNLNVILMVFVVQRIAIENKEHQEKKEIAQLI